VNRYEVRFTKEAKKDVVALTPKLKKKKKMPQVSEGRAVSFSQSPPGVETPG